MVGMTLVWLPFDPAELGDAPSSLDYEVVRDLDDLDALPASVSEVEVFVPPYSVGPEVREVIGRMHSLRILQTLTAGVDNLRDVVPDGVLLCNGRGIHDTSTSEVAVTLTLASLRGAPRWVRSQDRSSWDPFEGDSLADREVLLVGYGAIGAAIEARLLPFECSVTRVARTARDGVHAISELPDLLPSADVVILIVPLTDLTRGLVDAEFLAAMPDGALLVNVARGAVVDTDALVAELTSGRLRAALDVTDPEPLPEDHPLWSAPGVLVSPHIGGANTAMWPRAHRLVREQLHRIAAGEEPVNVMRGQY
jgi:phosphoglycerate dehydrogenase-like enzyme